MRKFRRLALALFVLLTAQAAWAQTPRKFAFRATHYEVSATILPSERTLTARARVEFQATEASRIVEAELHPNLKVTKVTGGDGKPLNFDRDAGTPLIVRTTLAQPPAPGQKVSLTYEYAGPLGGEANSPVEGVRLASIGSEGAVLLLPARWFPLTDYPANRYTAVFNLDVPEEFAVAGTGKGAKGAATGSRVVYTYRSERAESAGTFVAARMQANPVRAEGLTISVYTRAADANTAAAYGEAVARIVNFFSEQFGPLPQPNLTLAQIPEGSVQGYAGPGLLLVGLRQWTPKVNDRLLAQLTARQWWGNEVRPASPSDAWLSDGVARYSEALYVEKTAGKEGFNRVLEDFAVGALTYEDAAPIAQAARLEPFSTEYRSVVINKGAMVLHMLRAQLGDEAFHAALRDFYTRYAGKTVRLEDFQKLAQEKVRANASGSSPAPNLTPFFAQWLNSTGVPELKVEYVIYRIAKGFRIAGKIKHDLETFRMPLELKIETEGNPEFKTIELIGANSDFTIETFGRPKPGGIVLDPNNNLLKSSPKLRVRAAIARGEELAELGRYYDAIQQYQQAVEVQANNSLAHFRMGEAFFYQKNYQAAANAFREAAEGDLDPGYKWAEVWSHIYLGKIFDISGQRERAVNEYRKAKETNDDTGGAQAEADRYIAQPYKEDTSVRSSSP